MRWAQRMWVACLAVACLAAATGPTRTVVAQDELDSLAAVQERGVLEVALYDAFPPYSYKNDKGQPAGIDVDLARALAEQLGLKVKLRLFAADESMSDDLRNNLWKGHYLGGGVADVMLHVAADPQFAAQEDKVAFFGTYFSEAVAVAYHPDRIEALESPLALMTQKVGVEIDSISDYYLSGAFNGRLRSAAVRHPSLSAAVAAFAAGEVDAVMAPRGELQGLLHAADLADLEFRQQELVGLFRTTWDVGLAVKQRDDTRLQDALATALAALKAEGRLAGIFESHGVSYTAPDTEIAGAGGH